MDEAQLKCDIAFSITVLPFPEFYQEIGQIILNILNGDNFFNNGDILVIQKEKQCGP